MGASAIGKPGAATAGAPTPWETDGVARNRSGPPGRRAELRILYADGGDRDACLRGERLLHERPSAIPPPAMPPPIPIPLERKPDRISFPSRALAPDATPPPALVPPPAPVGPIAAGPGRAAGRDAGRDVTGSPPAPPIVLGGQPWSDGVVLDASPEARALGVRRGLSLASAHRLAPEAVFLHPDPAADAAALEAALE